MVRPQMISLRKINRFAYRAHESPQFASKSRSIQSPSYPLCYHAHVMSSLIIFFKQRSRLLRILIVNIQHIPLVHILVMGAISYYPAQSGGVRVRLSLPSNMYNPCLKDDLRNRFAKRMFTLKNHPLLNRVRRLRPGVSVITVLLE